MLLEVVIIFEPLYRQSVFLTGQIQIHDYPQNVHLCTRNSNLAAISDTIRLSIRAAHPVFPIWKRELALLVVRTRDVHARVELEEVRRPEEHAEMLHRHDGPVFRPRDMSDTYKPQGQYHIYISDIAAHTHPS